MALAFMTSPTELEHEYTNAIDSLFCRFDPITFNEESYISLFTRSIQENNEHYELDGFLEACEKKENIHQLMWAYEKKVIEETKKKYSDIDKEFVKLEESIQKAIEINKCREELETLKSRYAENESKLTLLENDSNELKSHNQNQMEMIRSIQSDDQKRISQYNDSILLPIKITETLAGIKIVEAASNSGGDYDQPTAAAAVDVVADSENAPGDRISNSFDVMFLDLPDDCLNFEDKQGLPPNPQIKLSTNLLDKYRVIHRKRKQQANAQLQSIQIGRIPLRGLVVSQLSDFKTIYENFHTLLCSYLTKQEIQKASTRFGVDWIEGSPVISIILDSKATKMATLVLTKYFPMCGTSMIKLTSMTGYENSKIKNFRIAQNLGSLVEWMEQFIELYRTNQLE